MKHPSVVPSARRAGFTLIELLVSLTLFTIILGAAVSFFVTQIRTFTLGAQASLTTAGSQFTITTLEREIRTAGTNIAPRQPWLVYAKGDMIAFNADYTTNVIEPSAVYFDPDAPAGELSALRRAEAFTLPTTAVSYPDSTYWESTNVPSPAELLSYWFQLDTTTTRTDDYVLYKQINSSTPSAIGRNILRSDTVPFFQYYRYRPLGDGRPGPLQIPTSELPLRHSKPLHLAVGDTGIFARIDSVRAVRVTFSMMNGKTGTLQRELRRSRFIVMRNGGLATQQSCGTKPLFTGPFTATNRIIGGTKVVQLLWTAASDQTAGERDVIRYVIYRMAPGDLIGDPYLSIPASVASYTYNDSNVTAGQTWTYAIAAQDCTPSLSDALFAPAVTVP